MSRRGHSRVNTRRTHPFFFHVVMACGVLQVLLALNFWFGPPAAFIPFGISQKLVGSAFFLLGAGLVLGLNVRRDLRKLRIVLAVAVGFSLFWGVANTQQVVNGNASWQLPCLLAFLSVVQFCCLVESPVNPMTERGQ